MKEKKERMKERKREKFQCVLSSALGVRIDRQGDKEAQECLPEATLQASSTGVSIHSKFSHESVRLATFLERVTGRIQSFFSFGVIAQSLLCIFVCIWRDARKRFKRGGSLWNMRNSHLGCTYTGSVLFQSKTLVSDTVFFLQFLSTSNLRSFSPSVYRYFCLYIAAVCTYIDTSINVRIIPGKTLSEHSVSLHLFVYLYVSLHSHVDIYFRCLHA